MVELHNAKKSSKLGPDWDVTVEWAEMEFPEEWILMDISHKDEVDSWASSGKIISHSPNKEVVKRAKNRIIKRVPDSTPRLTLFQAPRAIRTGEEFRQALELLKSDEKAWDDFVRRRRGFI